MTEGSRLRDGAEATVKGQCKENRRLVGPRGELRRALGASRERGKSSVSSSGQQTVVTGRDAHAHVHAQARTHIHTCTDVCTHVHTNSAHTHVHAHTHVRTQAHGQQAVTIQDRLSIR